MSTFVGLGLPLEKKPKKKVAKAADPEQAGKPAGQEQPVEGEPAQPGDKA